MRVTVTLKADYLVNKTSFSFDVILKVVVDQQI